MESTYHYYFFIFVLFQRSSSPVVDLYSGGGRSEEFRRQRWMGVTDSWYGGQSSEKRTCFNFQLVEWGRERWMDVGWCKARDFVVQSGFLTVYGNERQSFPSTWMHRVCGSSISALSSARPTIFSELRVGNSLIELSEGTPSLTMH